jgi:hypothetical protein
MLKEQMKPKHLNVDTGKTTLALENPYWGLMEYLLMRMAIVIGASGATAIE